MGKEKFGKRENKLIHNPGYDFLRLVNWMDESDKSNSDPTIAAYLKETVALIFACCAFEGYINMVGQNIDENWNWNMAKKRNVSIKDRISQIYAKIHKEVVFGEGIWQEILGLFKTRASLVHPKYIEKQQENEIPDLFQIINAKYPTTKTKQLVETAINTLLKDTDLEHLRDLTQVKYYHGPPRD